MGIYANFAGGRKLQSGEKNHDAQKAAGI